LGQGRQSRPHGGELAGPSLRSTAGSYWKPVLGRHQKHHALQVTCDVMQGLHF
jgi:hypothetical protein